MHMRQHQVGESPTTRRDRVSSRPIRNPARLVWRGILVPALAWLVLVPLSVLVPKRRGLVLFIGLGERFTDSVKYVFLAASRSHHQGVRPVVLAADRALADRLRSKGLQALVRGTWAAWWTQLRAQIVVADSVAWVRPVRFQAMFGARRVQLWHGCPLKQIERDDRRLAGPEAPWLQRAMHALSGRFATVDLLLSPSAFFTRAAFSTAFRARRIIEDNYPRNDVFFEHDPAFSLEVDAECQDRIRQARRTGLRVVLYAPTFRDGGGNALADEALDLAALEQHAETNGLLYVLKWHAVDGSAAAIPPGPRILICSPGLDIYPMLPEIDLLVTDYSSIFFDFLHTDRPIVFFPYDIDRYVSRDRELYVDYATSAPGPIVMDQASLQVAVLAQLAAGGAGFARRRGALLDLSFARHDGGASQRVWAAIQAMALQ